MYTVIPLLFWFCFCVVGIAFHVSSDPGDGEYSVLVGSRRWFKQHGISVSSEHDQTLRELEEQRSTVVLAAVNQQAVAAFVLYAPLKPEARRVVAALSGMNIDVVMLTGDNSRTANALAKQVRHSDE